MKKETKDLLEKTVVELSNRAAKPDVTALDAMQLTQAALNTANASIGLQQQHLQNKATN